MILIILLSLTPLFNMSYINNLNNFLSENKKYIEENIIFIKKDDNLVYYYNTKKNKYYVTYENRKLESNGKINILDSTAIIINNKFIDFKKNKEIKIKKIIKIIKVKNYYYAILLIDNNRNKKLIYNGKIYNGEKIQNIRNKYFKINGTVYLQIKKDNKRNLFF